MTPELNDTHLRGCVLALFYRHRRERWHESSGSDVEPPLPPRDFVDICGQLEQHGLLAITVRRPYQGSIVGVGAKITASGIDAVETKGERSPILIVMPTYNFHGAQQVQIGDGNMQTPRVHA